MPSIGKLSIPNIRSKFFAVVVFFAVLFFAHTTTQAATLSISPSGGTVSVGKTISVRVVVGSGGQSINAVSGQVSFSNNTLQLIGLSKSGIVTLWAQDPSYSNAAGTASFQGVILNGYTGGAGTVITLIFRAVAQGTGTISIENGGSSVLLNDGQGTNVLSGTNGASFTIGKGSTSIIPAPKQVPQQTTPVPLVTTPPPAGGPTPGSANAPLFTAYESPLLPGNFVVVKGTATANSTVVITFTQALQNGNTTVAQTTLPTNAAGEFTFVSDQKVSEGSTYTLVATTSDGQHTDPLSLKVKNSLAFIFSGWIASIMAIKISAVLALLILLIICGYLVYRNHILKQHLQMLIDKFHDTQQK